MVNITYTQQNKIYPKERNIQLESIPTLADIIRITLANLSYANLIRAKARLEYHDTKSYLTYLQPKTNHIVYVNEYNLPQLKKFIVFINI